VCLVRYRTCSGVVSFFSVRYQTYRMPDGPAFRHFYVYMYMDIDKDMEHGHGHAV
jgi:hypothetical protein